MGSRTAGTISRIPGQTDRGGPVLYSISGAVYGGPCTLPCGAVDDAVAEAVEDD
jgi:hypothetical protein